MTITQIAAYVGAFIVLAIGGYLGGKVVDRLIEKEIRARQELETVEVNES